MKKYLLIASVGFSLCGVAQLAQASACAVDANIVSSNPVKVNQHFKRAIATLGYIKSKFGEDSGSMDALVMPRSLPIEVKVGSNGNVDFMIDNPKSGESEFTFHPKTAEKHLVDTGFDSFGGVLSYFVVKGNVTVSGKLASLFRKHQMKGSLILVGKGNYCESSFNKWVFGFSVNKKKVNFKTAQKLFNDKSLGQHQNEYPNEISFEAAGKFDSGQDQAEI